MDTAAQVGLRLRELRTARGLSLSELARRSGVGKATVSELEAGRRNPTLETLYALVTALKVPLSALYALAAHTEISGSAVDAVLTERFEDAEAITEIYRVRIRAGTVQQSTGHTSGATEHIIILSGSARVGDVAAPVLVGPGEHGGWPADLPHLYEALHGDVEALLTVRYPR